MIGERSRWGLQTCRDWLQRVGKFFGFVGKRFVINDGLYRAAALTFSSLLAIVPLMFVVFSLLSAYPVFQSAGIKVQNFIFENFVPATGKIVQAYLQSFTVQASRLSITGIMFLFVTALTVMYTIEDSLNLIWRVRIRRQGISAFLMYWAVLTLTPVLMGLSIAASTYLMSLSWFANDQFGQYPVYGLAWLPNLLALALFTLLYMVVPNCKVSLKHAFYGALFSATFVQIAKSLFLFYVTTFDTYELLYGAFAILPLFFLWIYYVWLIVLVGAEVAHAFSAGYDRRLGEKIDGFTHAIRWIYLLWQAQCQGKTLSFAQLINADPYGYDVDPDDVLACLLEVGLVRRTSNDNYILNRDISQVTLRQCYQLLPWKIPLSEGYVTTRGAFEKPFYEHILQIELLSQGELDRPLRAIFPSE
jgi:membrane protein